MPVKAAPGERYTIRRKILKVLGAAFHVYDPSGGLVAYCKQRALRLKEDIRLYTDESCKEELFILKARSIIDFGATYDVNLPDGSAIGSLRRKGFKSMVRDSWLVFSPDGAQIGTLKEDSSGKAFMRRILPLYNVFSPQRFHLSNATGDTVAVFRTHFNLFVYRLGVAVTAEDPVFDDLMILAAGCLIAAIEGRQDSQGSGMLDLLSN
ncbi:MAG: hypothetical protein H6811_10865 [Phycisphaeraceae bacterium]|nr:hypothetical protein [Phycisphaeraceae bacterium]